MKKLSMTIAFVFCLLLVACGQEEQAATVYEPITSASIEVALETELLLTSSVITEQGVQVAGASMTHDEVAELFEALEIELPELPEASFQFALELVEYEFDHDLEDRQAFEAFEVITVATGETGRFSDLTFEHAGTYTLRVSQVDFSSTPIGIAPLDEVDLEDIDLDDLEVVTPEFDPIDAEAEIDNWELDLTEVYVVITVTEDAENEMLVAEMDVTDAIVFENFYTFDVTDLLEDALVLAWEERVAQAYLEGYEYVSDDNGLYQRVEIEVEEDQPEDVSVEEDAAVDADETDEPVVEAPSTENQVVDGSLPSVPPAVETPVNNAPTPQPQPEPESTPEAPQPEPEAPVYVPQPDPAPPQDGPEFTDIGPGSTCEAVATSSVCLHQGTNTCLQWAYNFEFKDQNGNPCMPDGW